MITICPQCQLPLAVTAADLRIAQGQVRCGRCAAVFNALASLYEPGSGTVERRPAAPEIASAAVATPTAPLPSPEPAPGPAEPPGAPTPSPGASGLFRTLQRDDEPRFDDTHGADDWPPDVPAQAAADDWPPDAPAQAAAAEPAAAAAAAPATDAPPAAGPAPAEPPETTDSFIREALAADELDLDLGAPSSHSPEHAEDVAPAPANEPPPPAPARDWSIDTMTAAELAALVARAEHDEPPELASIRITVDADSEITVLPGESLAARDGVPAPPPVADVAPPAQRPLPRLTQATEDDPDLAGARRAAAERRAAMPPANSTLRWLELEPAPPPVGPPEGAPTAAPAPVQAPARAAAVAAPAVPTPEPAPGPEEPRPGALAAALGLDSELRPLDARRGTSEDAGASASPTADATDAVVAELAGGGAADTAGTPRWMWAATVMLGLALAAQLAHLYREELAALPGLREPLGRIYSGLGRPLEPRWQLDRYELRQQGVVAEPVAAGTLTVRASIRNGAERAQPAPLLRVTLQDRFGNRVATRDLTPREYGGAAAIAPAPMLVPGQRIDAEVALLDPGGEAVGFELDVCLRGPDAVVGCANDAQPPGG